MNPLHPRYIKRSNFFWWHVPLYLASLCLAFDAFAQNWQPKPFKVEYILTKGAVTLGEVTRELKRGSQNKFIYKSVSNPAGLFAFIAKDIIVEQSLWMVGDSQIKPIDYVYSRSGGKKERKVHLNFDWRQKQVSNITPQDPWTLAIPEGTQDKLLYQLTLMRDLQNGRKELAYAIADGGKLKTYRFDRLKDEYIDTPIGKLHTVRLQWARGDRVTKLWCAPGYNYLPVQIEQEEKGHLLNLKITSIKGLPQ